MIIHYLHAAMATMYETIMNLPLFKGLSRDQVSSFLEKTHIRFSRYEKGDMFISTKDIVTEVRCIISGNVRIIHDIGEKKSIRLSESQDGGNILGADKLFGMDTSYGFDAYAESQVSLLEFSKAQYINLLSSDSIYLINYLNFLSYRAQLRYSIFNNYPSDDLEAICARLIKAYCSTNSQNISLSFNISDLATFMNTHIDSITKSIKNLENRGIIKETPDGFSVIDRTLLSDS